MSVYLVTLDGSDIYYNNGNNNSHRNKLWILNIISKIIIYTSMAVCFTKLVYLY